MPENKYWYEQDGEGVQPRTVEDDRSSPMPGSMLDATLTRETLGKKFKSRKQRMDDILDNI